MGRVIFFIVLVFLTDACSAVRNRNVHSRMISEVIDGNYNEAVNDINGKDFYDEKSLLLKYLELGTVYYMKNEYHRALHYFDKAIAYGKSLYTVSVGSKLASVAANDTYDKYYGTAYELSMARFYASLCHYHLFEAGYYKTDDDEKNDDEEDNAVREIVLSPSDRKKHLSGAGAVVTEWSTFLKGLAKENAGSPVYKADVLNKIYAAFVSECAGGKKGRDTALKLYEDALDILFKNYNMYPTFNSKYAEFVAHFSSLPQLDKDGVSGIYVENTNAYEVLASFLRSQIDRLQKKESIAENVKLIVKDGLVSGKAVARFFVQLPTAFVHRHYGFSSFVSASVRLGAITFEYPKMQSRPPVLPYKVRVFDDKNDVVYEGDLPIVNPMSDIAYRVFKDSEEAVKGKIVARNLGKHMAALAAAYAVYRSGKNSVWGLIGAGLTYEGASAAIAASERADIRYWGTLTGNVFATSFALKAGKYRLAIYDNYYHHLDSIDIAVDGDDHIYDVNLPLRSYKAPAARDGNDFYYLPDDYDYQVDDYKADGYDSDGYHNSGDYRKDGYQTDNYRDDDYRYDDYQVDDEP